MKRKGPDTPGGVHGATPSGGGNFLDGILKSVSQLNASAQRGVSRSLKEDPLLDVASPYLIARPAAGSLAGNVGAGMKEVCRNVGCGMTTFEMDARRGDLVCSSCGAVQNQRSIEAQEEEHRTFSEDKEKGNDKSRAEVQRSRKGSIIGGANNPLGHAQALADEVSDDGTSLTAEERKRVDSLQMNLRLIADKMNKEKAAIEMANRDAESLVLSEKRHAACCKNIKSTGKCRLILKKNRVVVAASILVYADRAGDGKMDVASATWNQYVGVLNKMAADASTNELKTQYDITKELLACYYKHPPKLAEGEEYKYSCSEAGMENDAATPYANITGATASDWVPQIQNTLGLPYSIVGVANALLSHWTNHGSDSSDHKPLTLAATAICLAVKHLCRVDDVTATKMASFDHAKLAKASSVSIAVLEKALADLHNKMPPEFAC